MYTDFFGLAEKPFSITPDPRFLFLSERHSDALAHLFYGLEEAGGFTQLTGEVGTGKTTLLRSLLTRLHNNVDVALILNPHQSPVEFVRSIIRELRLSVDDNQETLTQLVDLLNKHLLKAHASGRRVVVLVDEAQQLPVDVLEQVRLLTNLETTSTKLLQIILVGQPELRELLARDDLRQVAQRITSRVHLDPLTLDESIKYIQHRLAVAGATSEIFTPKSLKVLAREAKGVPRLLNIIADRALLGAFASDQHQIDSSTVKRAVREVRGDQPRSFALASLIASACVVSIIAIWVIVYPVKPSPPPPTPPPSLADFLNAHADQTGTDTAFATLFKLWNLNFVANSDKPCAQASAAGLQCVSDRGTVAQLRRIDRPVIMSLIDRQAHEYQVVVSRTAPGLLTLVAGTASTSVHDEELAPFWYGDFLLIWRPPVADLKNIVPGQKGPEILWLRQAIAAALNLPQTPGNDVYDKHLQASVERFQKMDHLNIDGIVGPETQMLLDAALQPPGVPRLNVSSP